MSRQDTTKDRRSDMIKRLLLEDMFEEYQAKQPAPKKETKQTAKEEIKETPAETPVEEAPKGILKNTKIRFTDDEPDSKRAYWEKQAKARGLSLSYLKDGKRKKKSIAELRKELGQ